MLPARRANQRRRPGSRGLYAGSGVHQGGNTGRPRALHNGTPSAASGGRPRGTVRAARPSRPRPAPTNRLQVARPTRPNLTAPTIHGTGSSTFGYGPNKTAPTGTRPGGGSVALPHAPGTPLPAYAAVADKLPAFDYRDTAYNQAVATANYNYDTAGGEITGWRAEIEANKPKYTLGVFDANKADRRDFYDTNASLADRGIFNSGSRVVADVDRKGLLDKTMLDLSEQYGDAAAKRLMGQIDTAEAARLAERQMEIQGADQDALGRFMEQNPGVDPLRTGAQAPAPPAGKKYKPGWFQNSSGTWWFLNETGKYAPAQAPKDQSKIIQPPWAQYKSFGAAPAATAPKPTGTTRPVVRTNPKNNGRPRSARTVGGSGKKKVLR
jgi:hypothetical protein